MISVIVPTLTGREQTLERCVRAYEITTEPLTWELILVKDAPSWSMGCNTGAEQANGDILHFTADDLQPLDGWHVDALELLDTTDEIPAPRIHNHTSDSPMDNAIDGPDGAPTAFSRIPMMRRDQYQRIGPWPLVDYASDIWVGDKARSVGIQTRMVYSYRFIHHWSQIKRTDTPTRLKAAEIGLNRLRKQMPGYKPFTPTEGVHHGHQG